MTEKTSEITWGLKYLPNAVQGNSEKVEPEKVVIMTGTERENICIIGKMNAGKSSLLNLVTQSETSIVDETPGTTADTKVSFAEIHGIGPVKFFDTPGINEKGELGEKKRRKAFQYLDESNLVLLVVNPEDKEYDAEKEIIEKVSRSDTQLIIIFNLFTTEADIEGALLKIDPSSQYPHVAVRANKENYRKIFLEFLLWNYESKILKRDLLPFIGENRWYILNIPMDIETPQFRFLRPQQMAVEEITRKFAYAATFRMDLEKARTTGFEIEKLRYLRFLDSIEGEKLVITDSQAIDAVHPWTPESIPVTTFSIAMIQHKTGELKYLAEGLKVLENLRAGDRVLIAEACQHSRIGDDIGTKQIPRYLEQRYNWFNPEKDITYTFGKASYFPENLTDYRVIIHCGGCMADHQKLAARIRRGKQSGVAMTNYGLFLSFIQGKDVVKRVLKPFGIDLEAE
jgi:[FeFe] hydrogenase H-cluster maturation GTPase HydF